MHSGSTNPRQAFRIDNDSFVGTPLPPEEPTAENPPAGAMIDYFLNLLPPMSRWEIIDAQHKLVRRFSSEDKHPEKHPPSFPSPSVGFPTGGPLKQLRDAPLRLESCLGQFRRS